MSSFRIYVEKKPRFAIEAKTLFSKLKANLGLKNIDGLRIIYRYDVIDIDIKDFYKATTCIFSDSVLDFVYDRMPEFGYDEKVFACDLIDSRFDADAFTTANAISVLTGKPAPIVKFAKIYSIKGLVTSDDLNRIKSFVINPLYSKETSLDPVNPDELDLAWPFFSPLDTVIEGFTEMSSVELTSVIITHKLEISEEKLQKIQLYYKNRAKRNPTAIELKIINKCIANSNENSPLHYLFSDFNIDGSKEYEAHKNFLDLLNKNIDKSVPLSIKDAISAIKTDNCKYNVASNINDNFANIDPISSAEVSVSEALFSAIKQRISPICASHILATVSPFSNSNFTFNPQIENKVADFANKIDVPTGFARDIYKPEFSSRPLSIHSYCGTKQVEINSNINDGDKIYILGDAISSKSPYIYAQYINSVYGFVSNVTVQNISKHIFSGNLFNEAINFNYGIAVNIDNVINSKYFDFTVFDDVFLSRTALVIDKNSTHQFVSLAESFGMQIIEAGSVIGDNSFVVYSNNNIIADLPKDFINSLTPSKDVKISINNKPQLENQTANIKSNWIKAIADANCIAQRGIYEMFDSTDRIAFSDEDTVSALCDFSATYKNSDDTLLAFSQSFANGSDNMYSSALFSISEALCKAVAKGVDINECDVSIDIGILGGAFESKVASSVYSILLAINDIKTRLGFNLSRITPFITHNSDNSVVMQAYTAGNIKSSTDFRLKRPGDKLVFIAPESDIMGIPELSSIKTAISYVSSLISSGKAKAVYPLGEGGVSEAVAKMCFAGKLGFNFTTEVNRKHLFGNCRGGFLVELENNVPTDYRVIGRVEDIYRINCPTFSLDLNELETVWISRLNNFYPSTTNFSIVPINKFKYDKHSSNVAKEKSNSVNVTIPVFIGSVGYKDLGKSFEKAGGNVEYIYIDLTSNESTSKSADRLSKALEASQILAIAGGYTGLNESSGKGEIISVFLQNEIVKSAVEHLLTNNSGLILGIGNGFQALLKTGLLPYGEYKDNSITKPTFAQNVIGRHQARIVKTRICSTLSPWLNSYRVDDINSIPVSYSHGRFIADVDLLSQLDENGQIAMQYVDYDGMPSTNIRYNPSNSVCAIEAITSPDGRILGKMGHSERTDSKIFENAIKFFKE